MRVLILTGGTVEENFAKDYISKWNPDQVITADKGLLYAKRLNIKPDIILGDFDSCSKNIMQEFSTDKKIIVPCEKAGRGQAGAGEQVRHQGAAGAGRCVRRRRQRSHRAECSEAGR